MDLFEAFKVGKESIIIKISCYDIEFLMPAVYTFKVEINLPPSNGILVIVPTEGNSISTIFEISL